MEALKPLRVDNDYPLRYDMLIELFAPGHVHMSCFEIACGLWVRLKVQLSGTGSGPLTVPC